jgi:hypothetical protein
VRGPHILLVSVIAFACSTDPVDPYQIDGTYSGQSETYREVTLQIDRSDDTVGGQLLIRDAALVVVFEGALAGAFSDPYQFQMQGSITTQGVVRLISLEGTVVHGGLGVTIVSTWLPEETLVLRQRK